MRLTQQEQQIIKDAVYDVMGTHARVWLFGSRVEDSQRGGDIDLFIETEIQDPMTRMRQSSKLWTQLQLRLGEQQIDIVLSTPESKYPKLIEQEARKTGICL
ncbi:MAG: hypothetical protein KAH77_00355 [Thiomargarita sp.]|nr:hypothetical protein [Thiomargarita sp.]